MSSDEVKPAPLKMKVPSLEELSDFVRNALNTVAKNEGFEKYTIETVPGANIGDGFIGLMLQVTFKGTKFNSKEISELSVMCKIPPLTKARREYFNTNLIFEREIIMYREYLPELMKFQKEKGLAPHEGFINFPKVYFADMDKETWEAAIVMENLKEAGYATASKFTTVDFTHARLVMEGLGRLHALSYSLKRQRPEIFKKYLLTDILVQLVTNPESKMMWENFFGQAINALKPEEIDFKEKLLKFKENIVEELTYLTSAEAAEPYAVLSHGDCWINNFMFNFDGKVPIGIKFIDFQVARYVSPVLDLVYFIFASTDKQFRDEHYDDLIRAYHSSLSALLERMGEKTNEILPFDALQGELKKFGRFGMPMAFMLIPATTMESQDIPDMDEMAEMMQKMKANGGEIVENEDTKKYQENFLKQSLKLGERIRNVTLDMERLGYI